MPYADPAAKAARQAAYRAARREELAAKQRDYHQRNKAERTAASAAYLQQHPDKQRAIRFANNANKRARRWSPSPGKVWARDLLAQLPLDTCRYCGSPADTWDHVVPLCRGGANALTNLAPACEPCNRRKARNVWRPST